MKMACRKVNQRMFMLLCRLPCGNQMQAARFPQFRSCRGRGARRGVFAIPQEILDVRNEQAFLARDIPHRNSQLVPLVIDLFLCLRCEGQYVATQKPFGWNRMADFAACLLAHRSDTRHVRHVRLRFYAAALSDKFRYLTAASIQMVLADTRRLVASFCTAFQTSK